MTAVILVAVWIAGAILAGIFVTWWLGVLMAILVFPLLFGFWNEVWLKTRVLMVLAREYKYDLPANASQMRTHTRMVRECREKRRRGNEFDLATQFIGVMVNSLSDSSIGLTQGEYTQRLEFSGNALSTALRLEQRGLLISPESMDWMKEASSNIFKLKR